ncbi:MAG: DNA primase [Verrucomicrobia bacterium]|nr:MAG: DNA primase [Verrucomicrobiota bacterium]
MPLISRNCIENIKEHISIHDVVSQYVSLKRTGATWKGLSPFNNEKSPSFFVIPDKNIFKCFSSGYAGDIFRFLQLKENLSFQEAIETIAHRFNIALEFEENSNGNVTAVSLKKELFEIHQIATEIFHSYFLSKSGDGEFIREYWEKERRFTLELAKEFKIGLAPVDPNLLIQLILKKKKFSVEAIRCCGLFFMKENEHNLSRCLSRFRGRLMIPITDVQERVIGFAGRKLAITPEDDPAKDAKYINSPETPIFHKGKTLFGLNHARKHIDEEGFFLLVEGQLDTLRCWDSGFKTAIAPQGTGVTEEQLRTLRRYSTKIYSFLDSDNAGQKASLRILSLALKEGLDIAFLPLPEGHDPDSYFIAKDSKEFRELLKMARTPMKFAVNAFSPKESPSAQEKIEILQNVFEILKECNSVVLQEEYLQELSYLLNINRQSIQLDFLQYKNKHRNFNKVVIAEKKQETTNEKLTSVEYQLLLIIFNDDNIAVSLAQNINPEWIFTNSVEAKILLRVLNEIREGLWQKNQSIDVLFEKDEEQNMIYTILSEELIMEEPLKAANGCLKKLFTNFINLKKNEIDHKISISKDENDIRKLQQEKINLRKFSQTPPSLPKFA